MYCNITQLSVKKTVKEIKIIFLCTIHFGQHFPPHIHGPNVCDSSAQLNTQYSDKTGLTHSQPPHSPSNVAK